MTAARRLRELLAGEVIVRALAPQDALTARVMEGAGVELLFLGGFGVTASLLGLPDLGLLTQTEMAETVRRVTSCVRVPVVADADTGFGEVHNVARTVREFEAAGAAGLILEDQVFPKRCGHFQGKEVVPAEEMVQKLQVALDNRRDADFVLFARTDALAVEGFEAAVERANRYAAAGADVCFVEAPRDREQLERLPREVQAPLLANMLVGGTTPILSADELEGLGYRIVVSPIAAVAATAFAVREVARAMQEEGRVDGLADRLESFDEVKRLLRLEEFLS